MRINPDSVANILPDFNAKDKVSLFVYSKGLKKIDLDHLSPVDRRAKLQNLAKDSRFVAVVEKGDTLFAFASTKLAEQLQGQQDLSIDGKRVSVKGLSDSEYDRLSEVGRAIESYIELNPHHEVQEEHREGKSRNSEAHLLTSYQTKFHLKNLTTFDKVILNLIKSDHKIIMSMLNKWNEASKEEAKKTKEDNLKKREASQDLLKREIYRGILKEEIKKEEQL